MNILENWEIEQGSAVSYFCIKCKKEMTKPKFLIVERIGKNRYWVKGAYCNLHKPIKKSK